MSPAGFGTHGTNGVSPSIASGPAGLRAAGARRVAAGRAGGVVTATAVTDEAEASVALDDAFEREIAADRASLEAHARAAARTLRPLPYAILLAALGAICAVAAGMSPRLREYR